ncbi:MAG: ribonuclease III [Clostridiales bacterium]|nr:ribonuclease III [Clostridiales bacterium]
MTNTDYSTFEADLGYVFKDKALLETAFTHTTYVFENGGEHWQSNQRLEFIGDAVLDVVVGEMIYDMRPQCDEGFLSKTRSAAVCERSFAEIARELNFGRYLLLGKGESASGGADKDSNLADCFESVIAAVYFDGGFENARSVIYKNLSDTVNKAVNGEIFMDYKSRLLEISQNKGCRHQIKFVIVDERGPAHQKEFDCEVYADDTFLAKATGHSKKDAEQKCAREAIAVYNSTFVV